MVSIHGGGKEPGAIELGQLFRILMGHWAMIALLALLGALSGAGLGWWIKPRYESQVLLVPTDPPKLDQLGAAAALLGKNGISGDVDLYNALLTSRTVLRKLLNSYMPNRSDTGRGRQEPLFRILGIDTSDGIRLQKAMKQLGKGVEVVAPASQGSGILKVSVHAGQPWLAQQMANTVVQLGQDAIEEVRAHQSVTQIGKLKGAMEAARSEWEASINALTVFRERNRSLILPSQQTYHQKLITEVQVKEQKYLLSRRALEERELNRLQAAAPTVVLDSADLPPMKPPRANLVPFTVLGCLFGLFLGAGLAILPTFWGRGIL